MSNNVIPARPGVVSIPSVSFDEMRRLAESIAKSNLFGMKTPDQALALMAIAQAEGRHPALAARDYSIIQGRPAKNSEAMMRDFLESGGRVEWHELSDAAVEASFSHPAGGTACIRWDMDRARTAGLGGKDNWKKYPRQMLRSRVVSEGVRTVCPMATSGMYVPEEVADFETRPEPRDVTPPRPTLAAPAERPAAVTSMAQSPIRSVTGSEPPHDPETGEIAPHTIPLPFTQNGGADYLTWGRSFIAGIKTATTVAEWAGWCEANRASIERAQEAAPKVYRSVSGAIQAVRDRLPADAEPDMIGEEDTGSVLSMVTQ